MTLDFLKVTFHERVYVGSLTSLCGRRVWNYPGAGSAVEFGSIVQMERRGQGQAIQISSYCRILGARRLEHGIKEMVR